MDFGAQKVYCISILERTDKRSYVSKLFTDLNIPFEFFIVKKDILNTARGCLTSHISVIKKAYDDGIQRLMVFEDDILYKPPPNKHKYIKCIKKFLDHEQWDIFFLGGTPNIWNSNIYPVQGYNNFIYKTY